MLKALKLWDYVSGQIERPEVKAEQAAWDKKDVQAQAILVPTLDAINANHIRSCTTVKAMFHKLKSIHSDSSVLNKQHTLTAFLNFKMKPDLTLVQNYNEVEELSRSLNEMGVVIDEATTVTKIVSALPDDKYKSLKKAWDSVTPDSQTMVNLLARLRKEDLEPSYAASDTKEAELSKAYQARPDNKAYTRKQKIDELKKKTKCAKCGKIGHWARECRSKQPQQQWQQTSGRQPGKASMLKQEHEYNGVDCWYSDSGASQHICGHGKEGLQDYQNEGHHAVHRRKWRAWPETFLDNLYVMHFKPAQSNAFNTHSVNKKLQLWYKRCAHINEEYIRNTVKKDAAIGLQLEELEGTIFCDTCQKAKQSRKPYPRIEHKRRTTIGEMVHADLSGKMPVASLGGSKYFLLLKDDACGFRVVYFLKEKSEAAHCIREYVNLMFNQTGHRLKTIRTDNGTEFVTSELASYFSKHGIIHETTTPFSAKSNGRIEREMRTIKDNSRAMMQQHDVPEFLWAEAVATSMFVHNRILNKQSPDVTGFEAVFGRRHHLGHLKEFGCTAFAHVPSKKRKVWEPKARKYLFVGYHKTSNHYRLYDPEKRIIIIARNVTFHESEFEAERVPTQIEVDNSTNEESDDEEGASDDLEFKDAAEIGRASCRERV